jgi:hypothetical protein
MRVEDGELVALVLEVDDERRIGRLELEPKGAGKAVDARQVALRDAVSNRKQAAGLVRSLRFRVGL